LSQNQEYLVFVSTSLFEIVDLILFLMSQT
jgi:hypothetical protein